MTSNLKITGTNNILLQYILIGIWLLLNIFQAGFTELAHDEAYYWVYSRYLEFGYFDHPPMIALLIKMGYALFNNEFGVRIFVVIINTLTLLILHQLTDRKNFILIFSIVSSIAAFQIYGFIAVPDAPLVFFTALFFLLYRKYLKQENLINTLLLSLVIALLLYSKYHGILIIIFTILSNLSLFKRKSFYLIIGLSLIFYLPHIIWQISNDYPSFEYHVNNKSQLPYNPLHSLYYILGQLLILGPVLSGLLIYASFKFKHTNLFEKALKFNLIGILFFFLLCTLNDNVEPNWTVSAIIPLAILSHKYIVEHLKLVNWVKSLAIVSVLLFLVLRINLVYELFPNSINVKSEFHEWDKWAKQIQLKSENKPVVFINSYQKASKYYFYTKQKAMSLNNFMYRRNQYDLWDIEDSLQGKSVFLIPNWELPNLNEVQTNKGKLNYLVIDNFRSYNKIFVETKNNEFELTPNETQRLPIVIINKYNHPIRFDLNKDYPVSLVCEIFKFEDFYKEQKILELTDMVLVKSHKLDFEFTTPDEECFCYLRLSIKSGWLPASVNSNLIRIKVRN